MEPYSGGLAALTLGLLLGLKHATDADHIVAVSTIVEEYRNAWRGIWVGASWGLGHTAPLLVLGTVILFFKGPVMDRYEAVVPVLEFGVGVMLLFLGGQVLWNLKRRRLHVHQHFKSDGSHVHIHATHERGAELSVERTHGFFHFGRPFFRVKSFTVGIVHGLAGSAAVMLLILPSLPSIWIGMGYLLLFGVGTVVSMSAITLALGVPFAVTGGSKRLNIAVAITAGVASTVIGVALMSDTMFGTALLPI